MRKKPGPRFLKLSFSIVALLMLVLSACGASGTPTGSTTSSAPVKGGTFTDDLYEDVDSLIPNGVSETYAVLVDQAIWAPLFYGDSKGIVHPGLASEIPTQANGDVSADLKTWTIKLRPNLVWSDGQPLNADDVNFTWKLWDSGTMPNLARTLLQATTRLRRRPSLPTNFQLHSTSALPTNLSSRSGRMAVLRRCLRTISQVCRLMRS